MMSCVALCFGRQLVTGVAIAFAEVIVQRWDNCLVYAMASDGSNAIGPEPKSDDIGLKGIRLRCL